ncbi:MAG: LamG domain-containing protein [Bacteroidota bacterium]|nr:LamG domain-containing protein [Bacteroidota bacterium]
MKTSKFSCFKLLVLVGGLFLFNSCKKDKSSVDYNSDKTQLTKTIDSLTQVLNKAIEGNKPGDYVAGAKTDLQNILSLAGSVASGQYTQQQVNNTVSNLLRAAQTFNSRIIQEVSVENLVAQWKFNGNALDSTPNHHDGVLKSGLIGPAPGMDGGALPLSVADRFGRPGMAYDFNNGGYVEVPYDQALNPKEFTFSLWIKRYSSYCDNYILSLNRWNGYKFQLQCSDFAFLTFHADNGYHDVDDNPGAIPLNVWTHVAVSYTNGTMKFYVNGDLVKTANVTGTPSTLANPIPLAIGQQLPKTIYNSASDGSYDYYGPAYFHGAMDDIRIYNRALTDAEMLSIYTIEKDL